MLQHKDIKKISELQNGFTSSWFDGHFLYKQFHALSVKPLIKSFNYLKTKGYGFDIIFTILVAIGFTDKSSVHALENSYWKRFFDAEKDTFYRLKNNPLINWRKLLWSFSRKFISSTAPISLYAKRIKCIIIDDTLLEKTGKYIEGVSKVFNHCGGKQCFVLGYKMLVMAFWDGVSLLPLDFSFHRESANDKTKPFGLLSKYFRNQFRTKRPKNSPGQQRKKELDEKKTDMAIRFFKSAIIHKIDFQYILMDSWFTCEPFVQAVFSVKSKVIHLLGMYKNCKTKFEYCQRLLTAYEIKKELGQTKRYKKSNLYYLDVVVKLNGIPVKLYFSRQGKNGKWKIFLTTNINLSFACMVEIYHIRWTIEVFFKETKQLLKLGNCQSNNFDGQIASATITLIQYILLTLRYRIDTYESKGALYDTIKQEAIKTTLDQRLWQLFMELINLFSEFSEMDIFDLLEKLLVNEEFYNGLKKILSPLSEAA